MNTWKIAVGRQFNCAITSFFISRQTPFWRSGLVACSIAFCTPHSEDLFSLKFYPIRPIEQNYLSADRDPSVFYSTYFFLKRKYFLVFFLKKFKRFCDSFYALVVKLSTTNKGTNMSSVVCAMLIVVVNMAVPTCIPSVAIDSRTSIFQHLFCA